MRKPETVFTDRVRSRLKKLNGCWFIKTMEMARIGVPDILGCYQGHFFAWEIKVGGNKATRIQLFVLSAISAAGGIARVVTPETFEEAFLELSNV